MKDAIDRPDDHLPARRAYAPPPAAHVDHVDDYTDNGYAQPAPARGFSFKILFRAVKRHWWWAIPLWLVGSVGLAVLAYTKIKPTYDAVTLAGRSRPRTVAQDPGRGVIGDSPATPPPTWTPRSCWSLSGPTVIRGTLAIMRQELIAALDPRSPPRPTPEADLRKDPPRRGDPQGRGPRDPQVEDDVGEDPKEVADHRRHGVTNAYLRKSEQWAGEDITAARSPASSADGRGLREERPVPARRQSAPRPSRPSVETPKGVGGRQGQGDGHGGDKEAAERPKLGHGYLTADQYRRANRAEVKPHPRRAAEGRGRPSSTSSGRPPTSGWRRSWRRAASSPEQVRLPRKSSQEFLALPEVAELNVGRSPRPGASRT